MITYFKIHLICLLLDILFWVYAMYDTDMSLEEMLKLESEIDGIETVKPKHIIIFTIMLPHLTAIIIIGSYIFDMRNNNNENDQDI